MSAAEEAYAKAVELIESTLRTGVTTLYLNEPAYSALDRLPPEIGSLSKVLAINLSKTNVSDLRPLQPLTQLKTLVLDGTRVMDLEALRDNVSLTALSFNDTHIGDLSPTAGMPLNTLRCARTAVADLRILCDEMESLGTNEDSNFSFEGCLATKLDPNLDLLSKIRWSKRRSQETRIYLASLPAWRTPLPWLNGGAAPPLTAMKGWLPEEIYPSSSPIVSSEQRPLLRTLTLAEARNIIQVDRTQLRARCQRAVEEIDDGLAIQAIRIPNDPVLLDAHTAVTNSLTLAKAVLISLHDALPEDTLDRPVTDVEANRLRTALKAAHQKLLDVTDYIDRPDHGTTYGRLLKLGTATTVAGVFCAFTGASMSLAVPVVYGALYGQKSK